jgi:hypothetical protein
VKELSLGVSICLDTISISILDLNSFKNKVSKTEMP